MAKVSVDKNKCIGCESCTTLCPRIFEMKNGKSVPKKAVVTDKGEIECAKHAEETCPVGAIKVSD